MNLVTGLVLGLLIMALGAAAMTVFAMYLLQRQITAAANRTSDKIDDVLAFVEASNKRIAAMEAKAKNTGRAA